MDECRLSLTNWTIDPISVVILGLVPRIHKLGLVRLISDPKATVIDGVYGS